MAKKQKQNKTKQKNDKKKSVELKQCE